MFIHVNLNQVVIDVTEDCILIGKNQTTGKTVIVRDREEALGVLSSESTIRPFVLKSFTEDYYNVLDVIPCDIIPDDYAPGKYIYDNGAFRENEDVVPATNDELTIRIEISEEDIADTRGGLMETSEETEANATDIVELRTAVMELSEEIEG